MNNDKNDFLAWLIIVFIAVIFSFCVAFSNSSRGASWVIDDAKVLQASEVKLLSYKLSELQEKTQVTVVIHTTDKPLRTDIREYAITKAREWKIGNKENKGIVIVLAMVEKKLSIEVGYGMEGIITDYQAHVLIENYLIPSIRKGKFYKAFVDTVEELTNIIDKEK